MFLLVAREDGYARRDIFPCRILDDLLDNSFVGEFPLVTLEAVHDVVSFSGHESSLLAFELLLRKDSPNCRDVRLHLFRLGNHALRLNTSPRLLVMSVAPDSRPAEQEFPLPHLAAHHLALDHHARGVAREFERVAIEQGHIAVLADFQ